MKQIIQYTTTPSGYVDDIPLFAEDAYWGKAPEEVLKKAIEVIDTKGWDEFNMKYQGKFDFTNDETRADWRFPITIDRKSVVLDIGAGMGRGTVPLARVAGTVVAFDPSIQRMRYLSRRIAQEKLDNVQLFVGDIFSLPIADGTFDVIAMNGILEWVGLSSKFTNATDAQRACLVACKRLLKKNGTLYIGIENRFALAYLKAADHGGLMFTSYMPRWMARVYFRIKKGRDYRMYTYTKKGYENLIKECGFSEVRFYLTFPGYNLPRIVWPYENLNVFQYVLRVLMPATTITRKVFCLLMVWKPLVRVYRYFFYSYNIIARQ